MCLNPSLRIEEDAVNASTTGISPGKLCQKVLNSVAFLSNWELVLVTNSGSGKKKHSAGLGQIVQPKTLESSLCSCVYYLKRALNVICKLGIMQV